MGRLPAAALLPNRNVSRVGVWRAGKNRVECCAHTTCDGGVYHNGTVPVRGLAEREQTSDRARGGDD